MQFSVMYVKLMGVNKDTNNCLIWGSENPHVSYELERVGPKENVWCEVTSEKVYVPFSRTLQKIA